MIGKFKRRKSAKPRSQSMRSPLSLEKEIVNKYRRRAIERARRYRLAFLHTNQRIVFVSLAILFLAGLLFSALVYWRLYVVQDYSDFAYNTTRILPLPVARVGSSFVSYHDYLQDLRRQIHYFESQQRVDFDQPSPDDLVVLDELKQMAMQRVVTHSYIDQLASKHKLSVSDEEVDQRLRRLQRQGKLGRTEADTERVLLSFWGMSLSEYRHALRDELLHEKIVKKEDQLRLKDRSAQARIKEIERKLLAGADFADMAREYSDNVSTAIRGGEYERSLSLKESEKDPIVLETIFATPIGKMSGIIDSGRQLEIIKVLSDEGNGRRRAAHISIVYVSLGEILSEIQEKEDVKIYIQDVEYFIEAAD